MGKIRRDTVSLEMGPEQSQLWGRNWDRTSGVTSRNSDELPFLLIVTNPQVFIVRKWIKITRFGLVETSKYVGAMSGCFSGKGGTAGTSRVVSILLTSLQISSQGGMHKRKGNSDGGKEVREIRDFPLSYQRLSPSPVPLSYSPAGGHVIASL